MPLSGEELEILFNSLIHPLGLSICLRVVCGHQLSVDAKFLVQRFDEPGRELRSSVANNTSWEPVESEHIANVKIRDAISVNLVDSEGKVRLLHVWVDVCSDGCVGLPVNSSARWESSDEICADYLLRSLRYDDWKCCRFGVRNRLESLTLFIASNVLVDEGVHEQPPVVTLNQFQGEIAAWVSGCD